MLFFRLLFAVDLLLSNWGTGHERNRQEVSEGKCWKSNIQRNEGNGRLEELRGKLGEMARSWKDKNNVFHIGLKPVSWAANHNRFRDSLCVKSS